MTRAQAVVLVAVAALVATGPSVANGFAYDDIPIIAENVRLRSWVSPLEWYGSGYWPREEGAANYRPFTMWMFNLQWQAAGGAPAVFHGVNTLLAAGNAVLVLLLAWHLLPPAGALAAGLLFAVHPVHVEATANVVGQAELWMAGLVLVSCLAFLRMQPRTTAPGRLLLVCLLVLAASAKEQGILVPAFLALTVLASGTAWQARLRQERTLLLWYILVGVSFLVVRTAIVGGVGVGEVAPGLREAGTGGRLAIALGVVPDALRLLVWPARLSADYLPPMLGGTTHWGWASSLGAVILLAAGVAVVMTWRRVPVVAAAILWVLVAWLPVSNLGTATGILLAERTLYLPSVGIVLLAGWVVSRARGDRARWLAATAVIAAVLLGGARSATRQGVWRDNRTLFSQMVLDAPRSYRTHALLASVAIGDGDLEKASQLFARADSLWPRDPRLLEDWAHLERRRTGCAAARPLLERSLALDPGRPLATAKLEACLRELAR